MKTIIRAYKSEDLPGMTAIWNEVVDDGAAFPQEELLSIETGNHFFASQSYTGIVEIDDKVRRSLYPSSQ